MKQDQLISKDKDFCKEKFKWNVEKYATPWGGQQCDPGQWG